MMSQKIKPFQVDHSIRWLLAVAVSCLLVVLGLKLFFDDLQDELRAKNANEQARLFIGEEIVRGIHGIEKDLYLLSTTTNLPAARRVTVNINGQIGKLRHDLGVLEHGGTVRREVLLNLEGRDEMVREATFAPTGAANQYVMEIIEISPLLEQLEEKVAALEALLARGWNYQETGDHHGFFLLHDEIDAFLKHIPPYFARLDENANRLFFDSSARLRELESELSRQRERLKQIEIGLMLLVMLLAGLVSVVFLRRINAANQQLEATLGEMRAAKNHAERASRAKSDFVSRMSHELRTPLNAIIGFAELLAAEPLPPSQKTYVGMINGAGKHLMELINAVLDHAKIEAGGMTVECIDFDLRGTIDSVASIVLERASARGLAFNLQIADDLPARIVGDPTRLRQILINLLVNAVKFTESGCVELGVAVDDSKLRFRIRDTGIGIDADGLSRLFKPFAQADETITRKYGGTGLGLLITKELVEVMHGSIEVDSQPGVGTTFHVSLPLRIADVAGNDPQATTSNTTATVREMLQGPVLLVDDNAVNQQLGIAMLKRLELDHDVADNGVQALHKIAGRDYALVLMDMEMPEMDGLAATRELRRREAEAGTPRLTIIAMTANALLEDRQRCFAAGMDGYISKPISLAALRDEINRLFAGRLTPPPVADSLPVAQAPCFDRQRVMEMIGDEDLFRELATLFIDDLPKQLGELEAAHAAGDWPVVERLAHTLKGLFATFAADVGETRARQLELSAASGDAARCTQLLPEVSALARELAGELLSQ